MDDLTQNIDAFEVDNDVVAGLKLGHSSLHLVT